MQTKKKKKKWGATTAKGIMEMICESDVDHVALLKACANHKDLQKGSRIHAHLLRTGLLDSDVYVGNTILSFYAKCGPLSKAVQLFEQLRHIRDVVSWNVLITGYTRHGHATEALKHFDRMEGEGIRPDAFTFVSVLKACAITHMSEKGEEVHVEMIKQGLLENDIFTGTALLDMYAKCGDLAKATYVFNRLATRNIVSWNALISGYSQLGHSKKALDSFISLQHEGFCPNSVTFVCALNSCGNLELYEKGKSIHAQIVNQGILEKNVLLNNALVDMYAKCGMIAQAREVFDEVQIQDVVTWNVLIAGYVKSGHGEEAMHSFKKMRQDGFSPDAVTFLCILKACGSIGAVIMGKEIHAEIVSKGLLEKDILISNALVDMYTKCSGPRTAQEVFDQLRFRDVVSWNALITGYARHKHGETALECFQQMQGEGLAANRVTLLCILKACGCLGAIHVGEDIHARLRREGVLPEDILLNTSLVDMYAKCGALKKAHEVFDEIQGHNVISWNALMSGYAQLGNDTDIVDLFNKMIRQGIEPDPVSFTIVLNVCNHSGQLDKGQMYIQMISTTYSITPTLVHHICMVDLFGRAGNFDTAVAMIKKVPISDYLPIWISLLGACQKWRNVKLGLRAFQNVVQWKKNHAAAYVCMGNIYAMQEEENNI